MADTAEKKADRLLVCVGPSPASADLIRAAGKLAVASQADWFAVYVEDPKMLRLPEAERHRAVYNLRLAEQLGAETVTLRGRSIAEELVNFARQRNITRIIAGQPVRKGGLRDILVKSPVDDLVRLSAGIEVDVMRGEPALEKEPPILLQPQRLRLAGYEMGFIYFLLATVLAFLMYPYFDLPNLIMVYPLGVMVTAIQCGRGPAIMNSVLSVLAFDFCFVPPRWSFNVEEVKYFVTFAVMFVTALVISHLAILIRRQAEASRLQERQTAAMFALNRQLSGTRGVGNILNVAVKQLAEIFQCQAVALLPDREGKLQVAAGDLPSVIQKDIVKELNLAQVVYQHGRMAGWGTQNQPESPILYIPLPGANGSLGVVALRPRDLEAEQWLLPEQLRLRFLESLTKQIAMALEVESLQKTTLEAQVVAETERLRATLLGSVTHDFQTPLAAIMGSASSLLDLESRLDLQSAREMLANIYDEAERLSRLVNNLMNIAKLESGSLTLHKETQPLEEVVGAALNRLEKRLADRPLTISLPADLPMVPLDGALAEHIFINLLENSLKYSPAGTPITVAAVRRDYEIEMEVTDQGPGFPPGDLERVFEMYYRGAKDQEQKGYGLGLSICRAIVAAHGGRIWAENRAGGGAAVKFTLPLGSSGT